jgi:hypothetical protein
MKTLMCMPSAVGSPSARPRQIPMSFTVGLDPHSLPLPRGLDPLTLKQLRPYESCQGKHEEWWC